MPPLKSFTGKMEEGIRAFFPILAVHLLSQNVKWKISPIYLKKRLITVATGRLPEKSSKQGTHIPLIYFQFADICGASQ